MGNEVDRELSEKYCVRFAELAVKKGYVNSEQAKEAMSEQVDDDLNNRPHRLIGRILMDRGWMSPQHIEAVLNELFQAGKV
jgi:hypothetical protein